VTKKMHVGRKGRIGRMHMCMPSPRRYKP
jgi:hypothetical protein